jgi:PAS domain S-box-containing protein
MSVEGLLDSITDGFVAFDAEWRFAFVNRSAVEYMGAFTSTSAAELLGKNLWTIFPVLVGSQVEENYRRAAAGSEALDFEIWSQTSGRCVAYRAMPSPTGLTVFFRDVTEQKRTIDALKASEARLRSVYENSLEGIVLTALTGEILDANPAACRMVGRTVAEIVGGGRGLAVDPSDPNVARFVDERARLGRASGELTLRRADGTGFPAECQSAIFTDGEGRVRTITTFHDLSEERRLAREQAQMSGEKTRLEAQLAVSDKMASIGTLASGIAHEINNPLAHVLLNLELIGEDLAAIAAACPSDALLGVAGKVEQARVGAERVQKIVRAIEMFNRTDARKAPVDLGAVIEMAVNLSAGEIRQRAVLVKDYGATPRVVADESRLEQVFVNLLVNAAQAIPEGRAASNEVGIKTWTNAEGRAVVEIRDSGGGIPAHLIERIFDPFFTTKEVGLGTGLGLSISHAIVTSLGGTLDVQSEPGHGTVFRVVLPGGAPVVVEARKSVPADAKAPHKRGRILVIDDEEAMGLLLEHGLGKEHATTSITSPLDALDQLRAGERFDAILCDVMMPELSGPELYARVRLFAPEQAARMIFMTGAAFSSTDWAFLEATSYPTLRKPFVLQAVRDAVRALVG